MNGLKATSGNLQVTADASTGAITATRISDGAVLLQQTGAVQWGTAAGGSSPGAVSAGISFAGHGASERIYGLGEHQNGKVQQLPYAKSFQVRRLRETALRSSPH